MIDGPYKLPEGWRWVRLGEVASEIQSGFAFRKKGARAGEVLHLRPYNIGNDGELKLDQQFKIPNTALPEHWSYLYPGDVLFNNTNSVELVGKTAIVKTVLQAVFSNHITRIRACLDKCEGEWLALALRTLWQQGFFAQQCNKWVGQAGYNTKMLKKTLIPLPPLNEQQRIVAKVEMLMEQVREARNLRQKACEDTDRLWQAVLADTFPRPGTDLPSNWRWVRLGEIFILRNGKFIRKSGLENSGEIRVYGSNGLIGYIRDVDPIIHTNTIVIGRVGACGAVNIALSPAWVSDNAMYVCEWLADCDLNYIALVLQHSKLGAFPKQGAQPSISQTEVYQTSIPLLPIDGQRRIVAYLETTHEKIISLKNSQVQFGTELQRLEQSILDSAFKGEL